MVTDPSQSHLQGKNTVAWGLVAGWGWTMTLQHRLDLCQGHPTPENENKRKLRPTCLHTAAPLPLEPAWGWLLTCQQLQYPGFVQAILSQYKINNLTWKEILCKKQKPLKLMQEKIVFFNTDFPSIPSCYRESLVAAWWNLFLIITPWTPNPSNLHLLQCTWLFLVS